jgi:hypothetical protein
MIFSLKTVISQQNSQSEVKLLLVNAYVYWFFFNSPLTIAPLSQMSNLLNTIYPW